MLVSFLCLFWITCKPDGHPKESPGVQTMAAGYLSPSQGEQPISVCRHIFAQLTAELLLGLGAPLAPREACQESQADVLALRADDLLTAGDSCFLIKTWPADPACLAPPAVVQTEQLGPSGTVSVGGERQGELRGSPGNQRHRAQGGSGLQCSTHLSGDETPALQGWRGLTGGEVSASEADHHSVQNPATWWLWAVEAGPWEGLHSDKCSEHLTRSLLAPGPQLPKLPALSAPPVLTSRGEGTKVW